MGVVWLAVRSLRHRYAAFTATFVAVLLGTALVGSFATLVETAAGPVPAQDAESLTVMGAVVGGWGAVIVLFSVASTVGLTVGQRDVEIGLLRTIGATPRQARRLVRAETLGVCLMAAALGALLAAAGGRALLAALVAGDVVSDVEFGGGAVSLPLTVAGILAVCLVAAAIAGRRATRGPASVTAADDLAGARPTRRWRVALALVLIAYGLGMGVVTVTVSGNSDDPYDAMATSGSSSLLVGVGLALLGPLLLPVGARLARPFLGGGDGAGYLAGYTASRRAHLLGGVLGPVVVLTSGAVGTLMLVGADGRTLVGEPPEGTETINLLNNVVVGMISLFAAIMVVNSFAAVVAHRRAELRQLWLVGGTRAQIERSVVAEAALVAAVGVVLGLVGSLATIIPFGLARGEGVLPDGQLWLPPLLVAGVAALTMLTARTLVRRATRSAAILVP
ncbi:FtsX-like permease family protein [Parafrankia sp. FMc2]|uniref:FtsX-like permease family protein n=1 Tax=Parafrankia sp. FMc2 TaxID=3233196 RepID=UPI0034D70508